MQSGQLNLTLFAHLCARPEDELDRRTGIPITLAVVLIEVGRRVGLDVRGVSFPGHFLVRCETPRGPVFVDPFSGRTLARDEIGALYTQTTGEQDGPLDRLLEP